MSLAHPVTCLVSDILGKEINVNGRQCVVSCPHEAGHLIYGPYQMVPEGTYEISFGLALGKVPNSRIGDFVVATLDVTANPGVHLVAERQLRRSELNDTFQSFTLKFSLPVPRLLEFRVKATGQAGLVVQIAPTINRSADKYRVMVNSDRLARSWDNEREFLDGYLRNVTGLIHIGANTGQERFLYEIIGLDVLWVEAIPSVYEQLIDNIAFLPRQHAVNALLTDAEGATYDFNVSNLGGGSSSILPFEQHAEILPDIKYVDTIQLTSTTFKALVEKEKIDLSAFQALAIDAEGAEMLILKGAGDLLKNFRYIKCEVSDFPSRTGCPNSADLDAILGELDSSRLSASRSHMARTGTARTGISSGSVGRPTSRCITLIRTSPLSLPALGKD